MKKFIATLLLLFMIVTSITGVAERIPTPNLNTFAVLKTHAYDNYIELSFDRHVDRVFVNWLGYEEVPEEIALDEYNRGTVITVGHKYMPGVPYNNAGKVSCKSDYEYIVLPANACPPANQAIIDEYMARKDVKVIEVVYPTKTTVTCENGQYIDLINGFITICPIKSTQAVATPYQVAYITVQGDWIVSYSRNGTLLNVVSNK